MLCVAPYGKDLSECKTKGNSIKQRKVIINLARSHK